ncbi:TonB-dependent receptor domain-containing protein [Neisseria wadsworthii]|uniref:TonB-dependent receptor domain-containing protein n=1 Tax=Neisseria wadsworthii TaxID=607711 RepID=UPI000D2FD2C4|nr:TonB-dependent receptor [Neisseria wadsworthii]
MAALENSGWKEKLIKRKAHAWSPTFSLSYRLGDNGRLYGRWAQTARMPSSFEDISGFSASRRSYKMKPERGTNLKIDYVTIYGTSCRAILKMPILSWAWYKNTIRNPIDRGDELTFIQRDKWATSGLELSSRCDNGKFFAELGANYLLSNRVCDENQVARTDVDFGQSPKCIDGGFPLGYMYNYGIAEIQFQFAGGRPFLRPQAGSGRPPDLPYRLQAFGGSERVCPKILSQF